MWKKSEAKNCVNLTKKAVYRYFDAKDNHRNRSRFLEWEIDIKSPSSFTFTQWFLRAIKQEVDKK